MTSSGREMRKFSPIRRHQEQNSSSREEEKLNALALIEIGTQKSGEKSPAGPLELSQIEEVLTLEDDQDRDEEVVEINIEALETVEYLDRDDLKKQMDFWAAQNKMALNFRTHKRERI